MKCAGASPNDRSTASTGEAGALWRPSWSFLRRGAAVYTDQGGGAHEIEWSLADVAIGGPFRVVTCEMRGFGVSATGVGDSLSARSGAIQAFAEAWERLWFRRLRHRLGRSDLGSSSGFAAGASAQDACLASKRELVERAVLLAAWSERRGWRHVDGPGLLGRALLSKARRRGWRFSFWALTEATFGIVAVGWGEHPILGIVFDSVFVGPERHLAGRLVKLSRALVRTSLLAAEDEIAAERPLPTVGDPSDHHVFYRDPKNLKAFAFFRDEARDMRDILLPDPASIVTNIIAEPTAFPAVALSKHRDWMPISWGAESIRGINTWPHPLA